MNTYKQIHYSYNKKGNRVIDYAIGEITFNCPINGLQLLEFKNVSPRQYIHGFKNIQDLTPVKIKQDILSDKFKDFAKTRFNVAIDVNRKIREGGKRFEAIFEALSATENLPFDAKGLDD
jgi:hypothetical protein